MFILLFHFWGAIRLFKTWETASAISSKQTEFSSLCWCFKWVSATTTETHSFSFLLTWPQLFFIYFCVHLLFDLIGTPTLDILLCSADVAFSRNLVCTCARMCGAVITPVVRPRYNDLSPRVSQWQVLAFLYWVPSNNKPASIHPSHLAGALCLYRPTLGAELLPPPARGLDKWSAGKRRRSCRVGSTAFFVKGLYCFSSGKGRLRGAFLLVHTKLSYGHKRPLF